LHGLNDKGNIDNCIFIGILNWLLTKIPTSQNQADDDEKDERIKEGNENETINNCKTNTNIAIRRIREIGWIDRGRRCSILKDGVC
jgi:hypothetical protein